MKISYAALGGDFQTRQRLGFNLVATKPSGVLGLSFDFPEKVGRRMRMRECVANRMLRTVYVQQLDSVRASIKRGSLKHREMCLDAGPAQIVD